MARAPKKKKINSLYDQFYGTPYEQQVNKAMRSIDEQMQDYARMLEDRIKRTAQAPTSHTVTHRNDIEKLRDTIRKGAKSGLYNTNTKQTTNLKRNVPVISEVVKIKNIPQFTDQTHRVELSFGAADYYSEQITTKIVGMEQVDWWEYVLIYGFFKSFKIAHEYSQVKEYIDKGIQSTRTVSGQNLLVKFIPKKKNDVYQNQDVVNGQQVIRETGTVYEGATLALEVPQKQEPKTEEYRRGYFVYEDTFSTLVIDYDALKEQIEKMLLDCEVNSSLIEEIKKTLNNGRLSAV